MKRLLLIVMFSLCALSSAQASGCRGKVINPLTDVCWSCMFPIKLGGITLSSGANKDPETDANALCMCVSGANITVGLVVLGAAQNRGSGAHSVLLPFARRLGAQCRIKSERPRPHTE